MLPCSLGASVDPLDRLARDNLQVLALRNRVVVSDGYESGSIPNTVPIADGGVPPSRVYVSEIKKRALNMPMTGTARTAKPSQARPHRKENKRTRFPPLLVCIAFGTVGQKNRKRTALLIDDCIVLWRPIPQKGNIVTIKQCQNQNTRQRLTPDYH